MRAREEEGVIKFQILGSLEEAMPSGYQRWLSDNTTLYSVNCKDKNKIAFK